MTEVAQVLEGSRDWWIEETSVLDGLRALPDASIHCVVTSPPYWGLRAYGTHPQIWGGDPGCSHEYVETRTAADNKNDPIGSEHADNRADREDLKTLRSGTRPQSAWTELVKPAANGITGEKGGAGVNNDQATATRRPNVSHACALCGAWRGELGSEPAVELFVEHLVLIFREIARVLRSDGTVWLNIGDSYAGSGRGPGNTFGGKSEQQFKRQGFEGTGGWQAAQRLPKNGGLHATLLAQAVIGNAWGPPPPGIKRKELCLIPERLAIALQADGWYVRSRIAWCKKSAMPESVKDRPTSAWEHIWLLTRKPDYFYDAEAVRQTAIHEGRVVKAYRPDARAVVDGANLRNYWQIESDELPDDESWVLGPEPFADAHFAVFPTELAKRCILAGTSERGVCATCGAPWRRIVDTSYRNPGNRTTNGPRSLQNREITAGYPVRLESQRETAGWEPTCKCADAGTRGAIVLDPFVGSGTTVLTALRHGRRGIGFEMNPKYVTMARKRVTNDSPLFNTESCS